MTWNELPGKSKAFELDVHREPENLCVSRIAIPEDKWSRKVLDKDSYAFYDHKEKVSNDYFAEKNWWQRLYLH